MYFETCGHKAPPREEGFIIFYIFCLFNTGSVHKLSALPLQCEYIFIVVVEDTLQHFADNIESLSTIPDNFYKTSFCHQQYIFY